MALSVGRPRGGAIAEINVTPMADVMIVLLIIFMVTAPIIAGPPVPLPAAVHPTEHKGETLNVAGTRRRRGHDRGIPSFRRHRPARRLPRGAGVGDPVAPDPDPGRPRRRRTATWNAS